MTEVTPVDLALFAGQAAQTQIGFGLAARSVTGDQMAKVIGTALIAAFAHHPIQPAGSQRRERLQRLTDERQIRIDQRLARWAASFWQSGLRQHAPHHTIMDVQLPRDRANGPFFEIGRAHV